jgi:hypothetical protein
MTSGDAFRRAEEQFYVLRGELSVGRITRA